MKKRLAMDNSCRDNFTVPAILLTSFIVKFSILIRFSDIPCLYDECYYQNLAISLASGNGFSVQSGIFKGFLWPPGYIVFLAAHKLFVSNWIVAAKLSQIILSLITAYIVYLTGKQFFSEKTGIAACLIFSFDPTLTAFTHYLWNETVYIFLFYIFLFCLLKSIGKCTADWLAATGIFLVLSAYIKPLAIFFYPLVMLWIVFFSGIDRKYLKKTLSIPLIVILLALAPWTIRNYNTFQRFVLIDANIGVNLISGNNPGGPANYDYKMWRNFIADENFDDSMNVIDRDRARTLSALEFIAQNPLTFLRNIPVKICDLFSPTSFLVRHIRLNIYGNQNSIAAKATVWFSVFYYMLTVLLAIPALSGDTGNKEPKTLFFFLLLFTIAVHSITFGMSRFRIPLMPFLIIYASYTITNWKKTFSSFNNSRLWGAVISAAIMAAIWLTRIWTLTN